MCPIVDLHAGHVDLAAVGQNGKMAAAFNALFLF